MMFIVLLGLDGTIGVQSSIHLEVLLESYYQVLGTAYAQHLVFM
jgi:hypothetical protein